MATFTHPKATGVSEEDAPNGGRVLKVKGKPKDLEEIGGAVGEFLASENGRVDRAEIDRDEG